MKVHYSFRGLAAFKAVRLSSKPEACSAGWKPAPQCSCRCFQVVVRASPCNQQPPGGFCETAGPRC